MILDALIHAQGLVFCVILLLGVMSVASWSFLISQWRQLAKRERSLAGFLSLFWREKQLATVYQKSNTHESIHVIFRSGYESLLQAAKQAEAAEQAMTIAQKKQESLMQKQLSWLSSLASAAPFVGLLGTVVGIMHAFHGMSQGQTLSLLAIAPGIAESLATTALGLCVALPAMFAFHRLSARADHLFEQYDVFRQEFVYLIRHQS
ncbi:MAG: MotA/TolQ/ExbB proton channel family protein [Candidatus Comchoanobacterales bacterium]